MDKNGFSSWLWDCPLVFLLLRGSGGQRVRGRALLDAWAFTAVQSVFGLVYLLPEVDGQQLQDQR